MGKFLVTALGMMLKPIASRVLGLAGTAVVAEVADQTLLGGAVTNTVVSGVQTIKAASDASGGVVNTIKNAFNSVSSDMDRNGLFALVPAAMALGAMTGDGIFGKLLSTVLLGALAYFGATLADKNGIKLPGLSSMFKSASIPAPANDTPAVEMKAPALQPLALQP